MGQELNCGVSAWDVWTGDEKTATKSCSEFAVNAEKYKPLGYNPSPRKRDTTLHHKQND